MHGDEMFFLIWVMMVIGGVVIILTGMLRRQKIIEMSHKERLAMIERGIAPPGNFADPSASMVATTHERAGSRSRMLSGGIMVIGFGLGLTVLIGVAAGEPNVALGIGGAIAIVGVSFVAIALVQGDRDQAPVSRPPMPPPPTPHGDREQKSYGGPGPS